MSRTIGEQSLNGVKLAGGVVLFGVCLLLVTYGLDQVWPDTGQVDWSAWVGWAEILLAVFLIPMTMHLWLQFFGGCSLFGLLNGIWAAVFGTGWHFPYKPYSRMEAIEIALFSAAALVWSTRFARVRPTIPDRIAITLYIFMIFIPPNHSHFSVWSMAGPIALFAAWVSYRWGRRKKGKRTAQLAGGDI
jgi:hypothetical protein